MDYHLAAWCITVAIDYVFGQVLLRHPELLRALQTIGVIYIKCITLGLLKAAQPPKTRTTSANGFLCWVDRLLLNPIGGKVMLLIFIQFAAFYNREPGAGVLFVSSISTSKKSGRLHDLDPSLRGVFAALIRHIC
jgi:hypothetical protein